MFEEFDNDGWQQSDTEQYVEDDNTNLIRYRIDQGLNILESRQHSLEPDMISGWRPKLPSCPLPISYSNNYVDSIVKHLIATNHFLFVYMGPRYINSVQINQRYNYYWKYRQRYSLNLAIVKEAVRNVGKQERQNVKVTKANHKFESAFQSGNLDMVIQVKRNQYDCFIRSDTNTKGHTNWYYFKVNNENQGIMKINICNMTKTRNLYSKGMKPFVKIGQNGQWNQNLCSEVIFVQRYCRYGFDKKTYQLQFNFKFTQKNQQVYFAYAIPYTFSRLQTFVKQIKQQYPHYAKVQKLCQSLGGIELPLLKITNDNIPLQEIENQNINFKQQKKKAIVITGRIHPGQSHSSHVLQGFIRSLLNNSEESQILRNMFVFYIIPMLNPDGVIAGNFRTSYIGKDLNRQFNKLNKYLFPQITYLCDFCKSLKRSYIRGIQFYFDFHGHSAKKNLFCYGPEHNPSKLYFFKARALAKIIQKIHPIFSYRKSIFTISQHKKTTGRAHMLNKLKIPMTFTFQISNGIYQNQKKVDVLLNSNILIQAGKTVFKGLFRYVQLEMKIPKKFIKAKVDTRNPMHKLNSAKSIRHNSQLFKKRSSKQLPQLRLTKSKAKNKSSLEDFQINDKTQSKEFLALIKQITNQEELIQIEGGSDSEGSSEDLSKDEINDLFTQVLKRNSCKDYKNQKMRKLKNRRLNYRRQEIQNKQVLTQEVDSKKPRPYRLIDLSKAPIQQKQLKRGISYQYEKVVVAQKNFTMFI